MIETILGYFVISFGILAIFFVIASEIGYKKDTIKMYGKDFWVHKSG